MRVGKVLFVAAMALALSACIDRRPLALSDDNPANPKAVAGFVDEPTAIADYKSPADFAERAAAEAKAPPANAMGDMPGMSGMPGMGSTNKQNGAASGAKPQ